jgi:plastocyanin
MQAESSGWRRLSGAHRGVWLTGAVAIMVAGGSLLAVTPVRADTQIAIAPGGCAGGGTTYCYQPESSAAIDGTAVTWVNASGVNHTVTSCTPEACGITSTGSDTFNLAVGGNNGDSNSFTFASTGTYTYYCRIHGYGDMHGTVTVTGKKGYATVQDDSHKLTYDSWTGVADSRASGGAYRTSATRNAIASFKFAGTAVTWVTRKGPDQGIASVTIDGGSEGTVDLYAASHQPFSQTYSGLTSAPHTIVVTVTGAANPASRGDIVAVDAFVVGSSTTEESAITVTFDRWVGATATYASGGTYRYNGASGGTASLTFTGTRVDWITSTGPAYGIAAVSIDGVGQGTVDLYSSSLTWHVFESYYGLASGTHTIAVTALGSRDTSSTGTRVVVDEFLVRP